MTIENSITNYIDIFGISFNLVLIYVTIISLYLDELEGGIIAAIIGLIKDITVGGFWCKCINFVYYCICNWIHERSAI